MSRDPSPLVSREIAYSQCWEDPATVREALRVTPEDEVLAITSGGCNAPALLLDQSRSLTTLDINPAQHYLLNPYMGLIIGFIRYWERIAQEAIVSRR